MFTRFHLSLMRLAAMLFYIAAAADYTATQLRFPPYLSLFTEAQIAYFTALPPWVDTVWAVSAWGGLLGAWLMWTNRSLAPIMLAVGFFGMAVLTLWLALISRPPMVSVTGMAGLWIMLAAVAAAALIWLYARAMHARGVLR